MAYLNFTQAANMSNPYVWYGNVTSTSSSSIKISSSTNPYGLYGIYQGSFVYSNTDLTGGTVTGYSQYYVSYDATTQKYTDVDYTVTGANLSAVLVKNYLASGNAYGLEEYVLNGADSITGSSKSDTLYAFAGNDNITGGAGNDTIDGGAGIDTAYFSGYKSQYSIYTNGYKATVTDSVSGRNGTDTLYNTERASFWDANVALDTSGNAGKAYRIYKAALCRTPDSKGLGDWIRSLDAGDDLESQVAAGFTNSAEFIQKYGARPSDTQFITLLYQNVLGRAPDAPGLKNWQDALNSGSSREHVLVGFSESTENIQNTASLIDKGIEYIQLQ